MEYPNVRRFVWLFVHVMVVGFLVYLVLAWRGVAAAVLALVERKPADRQMKVEILIAETGEGAPAGDRDAGRAGERADRHPALLEVRAGGVGRRRGQDERRDHRGYRE